MQLQEETKIFTPLPTTTEPDKNPTKKKHNVYRWGLAYGYLVYRLRWPIIGLWLIGLAVSIHFASLASSVLTSGNNTLPNSESTQVSTILDDKLNQHNAQVLVIFQSTQLQVSDTRYQHTVNDFISRAKSFSHVKQVNLGSIGQDKRTTFVNITFNNTADQVTAQLPAFSKLLPGATATSPIQAYLTGGPVVNDQISQITLQDVEKAEIIAIPITLVILLFVFNSLIAAAMPLLLALTAVPAALAIIYGIALHTSTSVFVLNIASIIGLGISIDYSLFMTRRFRDEIAQGRSPREAVAWMIAVAGEAVLFSGTTVMIGFIGLFFIRIQFMTSMGIGGAVVVGTSVLAALTLLPALLGIIGPRINALRIPFFGRTHAQQTKHVSLWRRLALIVMQRPVLFMLATCAILLAMSWPIFSLNIGSSDYTALPQSSSARQGLDILNKQFPTMNQQPVQVLVQTPHGSSILTADNVARVAHLTQWLASQPHISSVTSLTQLPSTPGAPTLTITQLKALYSSGAYQQNPGLTQYVASNTKDDTTLITVNANTKNDSSAGKELIDHLRANVKTQGQGLVVRIGGFQATSLDFNRALYGNFPLTVLFILLTTYILLLIMFRSVLLPLKAIVMNILSVGAALGVLVFIFQWGHFSRLLDFSTSGFIDSTIPALMFCILFGLSMDYEVFLLSSIREEWLATHDNRRAVIYGMEKTGSVITNAALLFVIVTGAFAFTRLVMTKEIGLGMTLAVLIDATLIRSLLVPATMRLLGRWNWWLPFKALPPKPLASPTADLD